MGSKSSHFKYGPGLLLDKSGCVIDTVGFCPDGFMNSGQLVENSTNNFQQNLRNQIQQQVNANTEPPTYNIINLIEKPPCLENDLFVPFMKPFSTYCPQPFETPIYPPFAMPRPLPCPQQEFLSPFSNFCKQTYPHIQQDPTLLPQLINPFTQIFFPPNQLAPTAQTIAPQFNPLQNNLQPALGLNSAINQGFNQNINQTLNANLHQGLNANLNQALNTNLNQVLSTNFSQGLNNANQIQPQLQAQIQPIFQFYPVPVPQPMSANQITPALQAPTLTQKFPQSTFNQQPQQMQQQLTAMLLQQSPFNLQPNTQKFQQQQTAQQSHVANSNFGQFQSLFSQAGFTQPTFFQNQNQNFQQQFNSQLPNFMNNLPTNSLLEHLSQIMVQPSCQPSAQVNNSIQKLLEQPAAQANLGLANFPNSFKPIPIAHQQQQQQSIQYLVQPSSTDPRNTQPFDQSGVPNISASLNLVRDSLGPRPLSFDQNSFANPFLSLHSLVGSQQPMNEPFAQSIEFLMNSS